MNHFTRPSWVVPTFLPLVFATDIAGTPTRAIASNFLVGGIAEALFRGQEQKKDKRARLYQKHSSHHPDFSSQEDMGLRKRLTSSFESSDTVLLDQSNDFS